VKRTALTTSLAVLAALAAAPSAHAKGYLSAIQVCGPATCATVDAPRPVMQRFGLDMLANELPKAASPPLLPFYRLRFRPRYELPEGDTFYIPGANVICKDGGCTEVPHDLAAAMSAAAANVDPLAPRIGPVTVNDRHRADPAAFAILFNQRPGALPSTDVWQSPHFSVIVTFTTVTPWSLGGASWMAYYPRFHALSRDGRWFHAGPAVDRLVRGRTAAEAGGDGHGWGIAAAAAVVLAAAAGAGRRLRRPGTG
jgi:hypothetical protein